MQEKQKVDFSQFVVARVEEQDLALAGAMLALFYGAPSRVRKLLRRPRKHRPRRRYSFRFPGERRKQMAQ